MHLENNLEHQLNAIYAVSDVFKNVELKKLSEISNPIFDRCSSVLKNNIANIQKGESYIDKSYIISEELKRNIVQSPYLNLDIKMETGTGKTYCYFRTMFELNKNYGINKFVLLVPSIAIKEGIKFFHKNEAFHTDLENLYDSTLYLYSLDAEKNVKKAKKNFPLTVLQFANDENLNEKTISVLLINSGMIENSKMLSEQYDQATIFNSYTPYDAIKQTNPFLIIDEPHRFKRDGVVLKRVVNEIAPQCIIRYGATFPEIKDDKTIKKDYENLLYNLGSVDAFNKDLVKGIAVSYPETKSSDEKIKVLDIGRKDRRPYAKFQNTKTKETFTLSIGDSLKIVNENFDGVKISKIEKSCICLSSGGEFHKSDILIPEIYGRSYQDVMLDRAITLHFEKEKENFRKDIKTLSLFFIDSIESIRGENGNDGYLLASFKEKIKEKLINEINNLKKELREVKNIKNEEYLEYLKCSLNKINETCASYFSADNSSSDEEIKEEIDKVLKGKDVITKFTKEDGSAEVTRFIFSKWTLKEGWDNPNIFVIAKLRSSGSEISKLQEVGRGLRLPIDKYGKCMTEGDFTLEYLVDESERNFANRLISEINIDSRCSTEIKLLFDIFFDWSSDTGNDINETIKNVEEKNYVIRDKINGGFFLNLEKLNEFISDEKYSSILEMDNVKQKIEQLSSLKNGKVIDRNKKERNTVDIKKQEFNKLKDLWKTITKRYFLRVENISDDRIIKFISDILKEGVFKSDNILKINKDLLQKGDKELLLSKTSIDIEIAKKNLPYSTFLKQIQENTNIPLHLFHTALVSYAKEGNRVNSEDFNYNTIKEFTSKWREKLIFEFTTKFTYESMSVINQDTALTENGKPRSFINASELGIYEDKENLKIDNYIYNSYRYDSEIEKATIKEKINSDTKKIEVFGKIPKNSIKIPTLDGTYSPDFMYVVYDSNDNKKFSLVIETKGVEDKETLRNSEKRKIESAKKFFDILQNETSFDVRFKTKTNNEELITLIKNT